MVENRPWVTFFSHAVLILGVLAVAFPLYVTFVASTLSLKEIMQVPMPLLPGSHLVENYSQVLGGGTTTGSKAAVSQMLTNSLVMALVIPLGKITISIISAFAIVYFRFPGRMFFFWMIFITLMLPVEVRIIPTLQVITDLKMNNTYAGLTIPLIASATATFLFRQFFMTIPDELAEAARVDGASPMRFFLDVMLPLSKTTMAALFVIQFIYGWNQYLLAAARGHRRIHVHHGDRHQAHDRRQRRRHEWNLIMATAILAMLPPALGHLMQMVREGPRGD